MSCKRSNKAARDKANGYWQLVAAGEPFRLFFPVGTLIGVCGVAMWPLFAAGLLPSYPGLSHARVMVEGFLASFVIGFLGTALPRLIDVPRFSLAESLGFGAAVIAVAALHFRGATYWGDQLFFVTLLLFLFNLGWRAVLFRKDVPPPGFVLVIAGMLCALAGVAAQILATAIPGILPDWARPLGQLLLHQGFLIFPIMGIGAFLLPRFFGLPNRQTFPESLAPPPGWLSRAGFALLCGAAVMAGFVAEALGHPRWGNGLRAAGILFYFLREVPAHKAGFGGGSLALGLRLALLAIPSAYVLMAIFPERIFSFLHILLISGISLLAFIVASRVVLGHSGQSDKFRANLRSVLILSALLWVAMLTRVSADWMPRLQIGHYAYAAYAWIAGVLVWAFAILPGVRRADTEE